MTTLDFGKYILLFFINLISQVSLPSRHKKSHNHYTSFCPSAALINHNYLKENYYYLHQMGQQKLCCFYAE